MVSLMGFAFPVFAVALLGAFSHDALVAYSDYENNNFSLSRRYRRPVFYLLRLIIWLCLALTASVLIPVLALGVSPVLVAFVIGFASATILSIPTALSRVRGSRQTGFWYGYSSALLLSPEQRPQIFDFRGKDLENKDAEEGLKEDWDRITGSVSWALVRAEDERLREIPRKGTQTEDERAASSEKTIISPRA
jgi:hypothetical protein